MKIKIPHLEINKNISLKQELWRKANHLLISILPISYFFLNKDQILYFLAPVCSTIIVVDYYRHKIKKLNTLFLKVFGSILRDHETNKLCGASYFSIAALLVFILAPKSIAICAFLVLAISDSMAAIIGKKIKSDPFYEKSSIGSLAFFMSGGLTVIAATTIRGEDILFSLFALLAVFVATIIEARPSLLKTDDNLSIPVSFAITSYAFNFIWIY